VPNAHAPPQSKLGALSMAPIACGLPSSGLSANGLAMRACCASLGRKVVSFMPSGFHTVSARCAPSALPVIFSTTAPSTSNDRLYSNTVPGCQTSGSFVSASATSLEVPMYDA